MSDAELVRAWFDWVASASLQLVVFVPVAAMLAHALREFPAKLRHALWLLVLLKALLPPQLSAAWGIGHFATQVSVQLHAPMLAVFFDPIGAIHGGLIPTDVHAAPSRPDLAWLVARESEFATSMASVCLGIWLAGACLLLSMARLQSVRIAHLIGKARDVREGPLHEAMILAAGRAGLDFLPRLVLSAEAATPFATGFHRPVVVLPADLPGQVGARDLASVLLHECLHLRRRDPLVVGLQLLVQAMFWFHPLVWIANENLSIERELCVDEEATGPQGLDVIAYARALLNIAATGAHGLRGVLAFLGIGRGRSELARRIERLLAPRRTTRAALVVGWATVAIFAFIFIPMGPLSPGDGRPMPPPQHASSTR